MTSDLNDIRRVIPVLEMAFRAEQLKMAKIVQRIADLRAQLTSLDRSESFDPLSTANRMGADVLWETWVQERKTLIMQEQALALRDREAQRSQLIAALSKLEAAKQVERRASQHAKQQVLRRSSW